MDNISEFDIDGLEFVGGPQPASFYTYRATHWATWKQRNGSIIRIVDMTYDHIQNSLNLMRRANQTHLRTFSALEKELAKRKKIC